MAFCGLALQANADVTVYVGSTSLVDGEEGAISLWLNCDDIVGAFSTEITLPEGITFTEATLTEAGEALIDGGGISLDVKNEGATLKIIAYGLGLGTIGDILFATAGVEVAEGAAGGNINVGTILAQYQYEDPENEGERKDGEKVTIDAPDAKGENVITVTDKLILDENAKSLPFYFEGDVTVKRALKANQWATICLPFEVEVEDLAAAMGTEIEVAEYSDIEAGDEGLEVSFEAVEETMEANVPYIIKPAAAVAEFEVSEAEVDPDEAGAIVESDNGQTKNKRVATGAFVGVLHAGSAIPLTIELQNLKEKHEAATLFVSGGKFFYTVEETQPIKAFRGYFAFVDANPDGGEVKMFVNGLETRIEEMQNNNVVSKGAIYDLTGKQVRNSNLKGIFIQDGKKVVK
jgi:hypothetical protein